MDECLRLRHLLEENMRSKDPLSDPQQIANIENQFNQQQQMLEQMGQENSRLMEALKTKDEESGQYMYTHILPFIS